MAAITVRNLPDDVQRRLKQRAAANNRSMEAEARAILSDAVEENEHFGRAWIEATEEFRGDPLPLPERWPTREIDLT